MKTPLTLLILLCLPVLAWAQSQETLFSGKNVKWGGYGGPVQSFSSIGGEFALFLGGQGAGTFKTEGGHQFHIGGAGFGLANAIKTPVPNSADEHYLMFGYGGVLLGYSYQPHKLVHVTTQTIIGGGHVSNAANRHNAVMGNGNEFFVLDPSIALELNVTKFFRINLGVNYRFVSGSNHNHFSDKDLSGPGALLAFRFGRF